MSQYFFEAVLEKPDQPGSWTYLVIPFGVEEAFGSKGQVKVRGTINGHPFRSSARPRGDGQHYLVVNKDIRDSIGAIPGSSVQVVMERDLDERTLDMPNDFDEALDADVIARARFDKMSYSHQKEYVEWIEAAKKDETRARRIVKAVEQIAEGIPLKS